MTMVPTIIVDSLARLWFQLDRRHREITRRNLAFALGQELTAAEREAVAREVFRQFMRLGGECLELLYLPRGVISSRVAITGMEHMQQALSRGKGVLGIAAHAGNWEYTVMGFALQCQPVAVVGRAHDHPAQARLITRLRSRGGNWPIPKQGGLKAIISHLRQKHAVGIVIDQNTASREGVLVDFFGRRTRTTPVAAILSRRFGSPVLPILSRRLPDGRHHMDIQPPLPRIKTADEKSDILQMVQDQTRAIENWVRRHPEQWLWLHRRWKNQYPELYQNL